MDILSKIFGKKKSETWITKPPVALPELTKYMNQKVLEKNAELQADLIKSQQELEQVKKKGQPDKELENLKEQAKQKQKVLKKIEKQKYVDFRLELKDKPSFSMLSRKPFGKFEKLYGVRLYQLSSGEMVFMPLLCTENSMMKSEKRVVENGVLNFRDLFKERDGIVSQIRTGSIVSNFDVVDGKLISYNDIMNVADPNNTMSDIEKLKYKRAISKRDDEIGALYSELTDARKSEKLALGKMRMLETRLSSEKIATDIASATAKASQDKLVPMVQELVKLWFTNQDAVANMELAQRLQHTYQETTDELCNKIAATFPMELQEIAREQIIQTAADIRSMTPPPPPPEKSVNLTPARGEEPKKVPEGENK